MEEEAQFVTVSTTVHDESQAETLAGQVVQGRLAACVQFWPIRSIYWWKKKVEQDSEFLLLAKTRRDLANRLVEYIEAIHPYEVPQVTVTPLLGGSRAYLDWMREETDAATHE